MKTTTYSVLFVRDWLKFSYPDEEGFINHLKILQEEKMGFDRKVLVNLAKAYNIKIPLGYELSLKILNL